VEDDVVERCDADGQLGRLSEATDLQVGRLRAATEPARAPGRKPSGALAPDTRLGGICNGAPVRETMPASARLRLALEDPSTCNW
jgi:hypothetical protein